MPIILPKVSPEIMKKYPLYVLIVFLSAFVGYETSKATTSDKEMVHLLNRKLEKAERERDSIVREKSDLQDALLIQNGILQRYKKVVARTDSLANTKIGKPAKALMKQR